MSRSYSILKKKKNQKKLFSSLRTLFLQFFNFYLLCNITMLGYFGTATNILISYVHVTVIFLENYILYAYIYI